MVLAETKQKLLHTELADSRKPWLSFICIEQDWKDITGARFFTLYYLYCEHEAPTEETCIEYENAD